MRWQSGRKWIKSKKPCLVTSPSETGGEDCQGEGLIPGNFGIVTSIYAWWAFEQDCGMTILFYLFIYKIIFYYFILIYINIYFISNKSTQWVSALAINVCMWYSVVDSRCNIVCSDLECNHLVWLKFCFSINVVALACCCSYASPQQLYSFHTGMGTWHSTGTLKLFLWTPGNEWRGEWCLSNSYKEKTI